jgi:hypothetical protein
MEAGPSPSEAMVPTCWYGKTAMFDNLADINDAGVKEGWAIFECFDSHDLRGNYTPYQLQKDDEAATFANDSNVWRHVVLRARAGSLLHQQTLAWLRINSPTEYTQVVRFVK